MARAATRRRDRRPARASRISSHCFQPPMCASTTVSSGYASRTRTKLRGVEDDDHAVRERGLVDGRHAIVVGMERLELRMQLDAAQPERCQARDLSPRIGVARVHRAKGEHAAGRQGGGPVADRRHALRPRRHRLYHGAGDTVLLHRRQQALKRAVDPRLHTGLLLQRRQRRGDDLVGEDVHVRVEDAPAMTDIGRHAITILSPASPSGRGSHPFARAPCRRCDETERPGHAGRPAATGAQRV